MSLYLEDKDVAGIHTRGLAKLIGCDPKTVQNALEGVKESCFENCETVTGIVFEGVNKGLFLDAKIQTAGGPQTVTFILENGVVEILERIADSKCKQETKDSARRLYRQFARAGFKLYAMLKVDPDALKKKVDAHKVFSRDSVEYIEAAKKLETVQNPILKSLIEQRMMEELTPTDRLLTGADTKTHVIATVRAHELGYSAKAIGSGAQLGKFILKQGIHPVGKAQHGRYPVNVYELSQELDRAIHAYFS